MGFRDKVYPLPTKRKGLDSDVSFPTGFGGEARSSKKFDVSIVSAFYPPWDGKMSSNSFTWVMEGGDPGTADWGCLAGRCASLCLQAVHNGHATTSPSCYGK